MKESLYDALREANVSESLAMKTANDIPDDIATRGDLKLAAAESENRSERALASFETSNAKALASFEISNAKAIAALRMTIAESEKGNEKSLADFKLTNEKAIAKFRKEINESQIKLMWRFLGFQTALTGIIASIFVAAMKLL